MRNQRSIALDARMVADYFRDEPKSEAMRDLVIHALTRKYRVGRARVVMAVSARNHVLAERKYLNERCDARTARAAQRVADRIDGYDRDDIGESADY
jgi:hypothetical protein